MFPVNWKNNGKNSSKAINLLSAFAERPKR